MWVVLGDMLMMLSPVVSRAAINTKMAVVAAPPKATENPAKRPFRAVLCNVSTVTGPGEIVLTIRYVMGIKTI